MVDSMIITIVKAETYIHIECQKLLTVVINTGGNLIFTRFCFPNLLKIPS